MGSIKSVFFQPKTEDFVLSTSTEKLANIERVLEAINEKLERLESRHSEYLTSIHKKEQLLEEIHHFFIDKVGSFLENSAFCPLEESLRKFEENIEENEVFRCHKAIRKEEKGEILKEKMKKRKHSARLEIARMSLKEEKLFGNLESLKKAEETPIKYSENI